MKRVKKLIGEVFVQQETSVIAVFFVSLLFWQPVSFFAIFNFGFLFWIIPFVLSALGLFLPQDGFIITTEFDGPVMLFTLFASAQNALMTRHYLRYKDSSKFVRIGYWLTMILFIAIVMTTNIWIVTVYGFSELLQNFIWFMA